MRELVFAEEQLAAMPEGVRAQIQTPEFQEMVRQQRRTGRRESMRAPARFTEASDWWKRVELERRGIIQT